MRVPEWLGISAAILLVAFIFFVPSKTSVQKVAVVAQESSSSSPELVVIPSEETAPITIQGLLPLLPTSTPAVATSTPKAVVPKKIVASTPVAAIPDPLPAVQAPVTPSGSAALDATATALRAALVNIICTAPYGSGIKSISGSGVIIDSRGVILTNAHIAQYFLLADKGVSCVIRTGSPAASKYRATLMFISPAWVSANAAVITEAVPAGDGEHDYAFLAITTAVPGASLPAAFSYVPLANTALLANDPVAIATYGAQFLQSAQIQSALYPTIVYGSVKDIFTFGTNTIDILALGGSIAAQEGSSGGGVANTSGALVATITTSTVEGDTSTRNVNAITATYIRRAYIEETGTTLETLFADTPANAAAAFAGNISALEALITAHLSQ